MYIFIILIIFFGELLIKNHIEKKCPDSKNKKIINRHIIIRRSHNYGFAFNRGEKHPAVVAALSLGLAVFCTLIFIFSFGERGNGMLKLGLSFLLGGAYSNTYDRIRRKYVVDYFSFAGEKNIFRNLVFNLSDFFILIGALLTVISYKK